MRLFHSHAKQVQAMCLLGVCALSSGLGLGTALAEPKPRMQSHGAIVASPIEPFPGAAKASNQTLLKKWQVRCDHQNSSTPALELNVAVPSLLVVRRDRRASEADQASSSSSSPALLARVEFSGDNEQLLDAIEMNTSKNTVLRIALEPKTKLQGHLMGEIILGPSVPLTSLSLRGDIALVVEDEEVFPDTQQDDAQDDAMAPSFKMNLLGAVKVFLSLPQHRRLRFESLEINSLGDSSVQVTTPTLQIDKKLKINSKGNCNIALCCQNLQVNGSVTTNLMGDGQVRAAASSLNVADDLKIDIWGDGRVYFGAKVNQSSCSRAQLSSWGFSRVDLGALQCAEASIKTRGDADVTLRVTDSLQLQTWPSGSVKLVGAFPANLTPVSSSDSSKSSRVQPAVDYPVDQDPMESASHLLKAVPSPQPILVCADKSSWLSSMLSSWLS